jgi:putative phosphoesterase
MIGILSDSHDNIPKIRQAMALFKSRACRLVLHAGDIIAPFAAQELAAAGRPVRAVFGNCDGEKEGLKNIIQAFGEIRPEPFVLDWEGKRIFLTHVPRQIEDELFGETYDLLVCGHTHKAEVRRQGKSVLINPGETGGWLYGRSTVGLFDPETGRAEIIGLD